MLLFIEEYPYDLDLQVRGKLIRDILGDVVKIPKKEKTYSPEYVGYCYSKEAKDAIFFLPKVVLTGNKNNNADETVFGASPIDIIDFDSLGKERFVDKEKADYKTFLSELSIWIYRVISVYKEQYNDNILESKETQTESAGKKTRHNTLLDVIIALREFNRKNQDYLTFIAKNQHSGYNKIQWTKTISHKTAVVQNNVPVYLEVVNKKKMINFDEELLIIYYSILNYIQHTYSFGFAINLNYPLISIEKMRTSYIQKKVGVRRLKQIKYKYFSDKALRIWDLCYAFFDREYEIAMNQNIEDYLLAKNFNQIFERMIDSLISEGKDKLPKDLTDQKDGKLVDHMFIGKGLIEQSDNLLEQTYYIGDSKYYKRRSGDTTTLGDTSIYKQYTYARNVVQWNLNLFLGLTKAENGQPQLRDELTEGYNPIPNFFISAHIPQKKDGKKYLSFDDDREITQQDGIRLSRQFENRLFDRDTLLLCHYDVNFLFIVSLYGRNNKSAQNTWREEVQNKFRKEIQETLNKIYKFYTLQPRHGMDCYQFIKDNFHILNGKIYRPRANDNYLVLALMKENAEQEVKKIYGSKTQSVLTNEKHLVDDLQEYFHVSEPFGLTEDLIVASVDDVGSLEKVEEKNVFVGIVKNNSEEKDDLLNGVAKEYHTGPAISSDINILQLRYFAPSIGNKIYGYYKITGIKQDHKNGDKHESFRLYFSLADYRKLEKATSFDFTDVVYGKMVSLRDIKQ